MLNKYNSLKAQAMVVKYCHSLALMKVPLEIKWDTAVLGTTQTLSEDGGTVVLTLGSDVLEIVQRYSASRELSMEFTTSSQMAYRVVVALHSELGVVNEESKRKLSGWFDYSIANTGKYYDNLETVRKQLGDSNE